MALQVCETFFSLMGESTRVGLPAFFIRLSGCNLRCRYCDTTYAYEGGREMEVADLLKAALGCLLQKIQNIQNTRLVLVTGGEPLLQEETLPLLAALADAGVEVCLETNGSRPIAPVDGRAELLAESGIPDPPGRSQICRERSPRFSLGAGGDSGPWLVRPAPPADFS